MLASTYENRKTFAMTSIKKFDPNSMNVLVIGTVARRRFISKLKRIEINIISRIRNLIKKL